MVSHSFYSVPSSVLEFLFFLFPNFIDTSFVQLCV